jgi:hypothetical protein
MGELQMNDEDMQGSDFVGVLGVRRTTLAG